MKLANRRFDWEANLVLSIISLGSLRMSNTYQSRMTRFVRAGAIIYGAAAIYIILQFNLTPIAWLIFVSTEFLAFAIATVADAVFESLKEKIEQAQVR